MSKIVLVNPPYTVWDETVPLPKTLENTTPSFGLCCLASVLRANGYEPKIVEAGALQLTLNQTMDRILKENPAAVGFRASTVSLHNAAILAEAIKKHNRDIITIIGGPHITALPIETIQDFTKFDVGVVGEGEETVVELLNSISGQATEAISSVAQVKGIVFRHDGRARLTERRPYMKNLDSLPMPAWDLIEGFPHRYQPPLMSYKELPVASMVTSRGCPFQCIFCDRSVFGNRYRSYSSGYVIAMMEHLIETYSIKHFIFYDDLFAASSSRLNEICSRIIDRKMNISWTCDARVDAVTPESLSLMKRAGCWEIAYGVESGSQKILDLVAKGITLKDIEQGVKWTHDAGIKVKGLFMMGHPMETRETIKETIDLAKRLPFDIINISKFTPFPGTEIYNKAHKYGTLNPDWNKMNAMTFVFIPHGFTEKEIEWEYKKAIAKYYWRPWKTLSLLMAMLKDPAGIKRLLKAGWDVMIFFIFKMMGRVRAA